MNEIAQLEPHVYRPSVMLDPQRFQYLWRMAEVIADSSLVPETLRTIGQKGSKQDLPRDRVVANCFLVVEQADRWDMSPFALISCASIVHGRLSFEGKVIAAVLEAKMGVRLDYQWSGEGEAMEIVISGIRPGETVPKTERGSVRDWKTTGEGSPWREKDYDKMLAYRGAREWARIWAPALMLGVLSHDDALDIQYETRARVASDVTPGVAARLQGGTAKGGFDPAGIQRQLPSGGQMPMEIVDEKTGEIVDVRTKPQETGAQRESEASAPADDRPGEQVQQEVHAESPTEVTGVVAKPDQSLVLKFSEALMRAMSAKSLDTIKKDFWVANGLTKQDPSMAALGKVFEAHKARVAGEGSPADVDKAVKEALA